GFIAVVPGFGALVYDNGRGLGEQIAPSTTICPVTRDEVILPLPTGAVRLPSRPFIGTIGVAPTYERRMTLSQSPDYLGDLDIPDLRAGSTIHVGPTTMEAFSRLEMSTRRRAMARWRVWRSRSPPG